MRGGELGRREERERWKSGFGFLQGSQRAVPMNLPDAKLKELKEGDTKKLQRGALNKKIF